MTVQSKVPLIVFCPRDISGGAHNYWLNLIDEVGFLASFDVSVIAQESLATTRVANQLKRFGINVFTYMPDSQPTRLRRAMRYLSPIKARSKCSRAEALHKELKRRHKAIVWFILDGFFSIGWCARALDVCNQNSAPFHLIVQHAHELINFESEDLCDIRYSQFASANRVIFVSQRNLQSVETAFGRRLDNSQLGVNGLTKKKFDWLWSLGKSNPPHIEGTARLSNIARFSIGFKGQNLLLSALNTTYFSEREWSCRLVGGGPDRWLIQRLANAGSSSKRFEIHDRTNSVHEVLASTDLFALPSYSEGMAFALIEAAAACRPLFATDVAGAAEIVKPQITGFLAPGTTASSVATTLQDAFESRGKWPSMGIAAHELARQHWCLDRYLTKVVQDGLSDLS